MQERTTERVLAAGAWPRRSSSSVSESAGSVFGSRRLELACLAGLGLLTVLLHSSVDWGLGIPGHHGLEWMALLMFGRSLSQERHAATVTALSAGGLALLPISGMNPSAAISYVLAGLVVDALCRLWRAPGPATLGLIAALAHASKPLWKLAATLGATVHFGSIAHGVGLTLCGHLMFGAVGGVAGALAGRALRGRLRRR
jgi:hypothetical protein